MSVWQALHDAHAHGFSSFQVAQGVIAYSCAAEDKTGTTAFS